VLTVGPKPDGRLESLTPRPGLREDL
jgi:hypothetical protein